MISRARRVCSQASSWLLLVLLAGLAQAAADDEKPDKKKEKDASIYTVSEYNPERDPAEDLSATVKKADGRHIILEIGGDWWGWCRILDEFVKVNKPVATVLQKNFLIMKVNYSGENRNEEFLKQYPKVPAYPHFFVLDADGKFLHSQGTAELEEGRGYDEKVFLTFLEKWKPGKKTE